MDELERYNKKRLERLVNYRDQFDLQRQGSVFQDCKHLMYSCTVQSFIGLMKIAFEGLSVEPETHNCGIWSREFTLNSPNPIPYLNYLSIFTTHMRTSLQF